MCAKVRQISLTPRFTFPPGPGQTPRLCLRIPDQVCNVNVVGFTACHACMLRRTMVLTVISRGLIGRLVS